MASATGEKRARVAVIGAGISGLVSLKECLAAGLQAVAFDARDTIGGAWAYQPVSLDEKHDDRDSEKDDFVISSMYDGTVINSCRDTTAFSDFPLDPARYPDYFRHDKMNRYLGEYAAHFGLEKHVRLQTRVLACEPKEDGTWKVRVRENNTNKQEEEEEELHFDAVIGATGHSSKPFTPEFEGREKFTGRFMHSHWYRTPGPFEGKKVVIVGFGSSAIDIACEIAPHAQELHMITSRGGWVLPRYVLGKPTEAWDNRATQLWVPHSISQSLQTALLKLVDIAPPPEMKPNHGLLEQGPTCRGDFLEKVATGLITIQRGSITSMHTTGLSLSNGTALDDVDAVICATGYDDAYLPYLPADVVRAQGTPSHLVDLHMHLMSPRHHNLFLVGYLENFGPLLPLAEAQARHVAAILTGLIPRPSPTQMAKEIAAEQAFQEKHFVRSQRHAHLVHGVAYTDALLAPLGARPGFATMLAKCFTGNPWTGLKLLSAVWFGLPSSAQWRLYGHGAKSELAKETVLRIAGEKKKMTEREVEALTRKL